MQAYAQKLFRLPARFVAAGTAPRMLPYSHAPSVVFVGRSNVGKSSLINKLVNHNGLARTSKTPGRTQTLNVFTIGPGQGVMELIDVPGYGWARADARSRRSWQDVVKALITTRRNIKIVNVLVDARRGVMPIDVDCMLDFLEENNQPYQLVLTKADELKQDVLESVFEKTCDMVDKSVQCQSVVVTSSRSGHGMDDLRTAIVELCGFVRPGTAKQTADAESQQPQQQQQQQHQPSTDDQPPVGDDATKSHNGG